jgi:Ca-activated chloride channel family protein
MLVATLRPDDMIGIATFNTSGREALAHTAVREAAAIHSAIDSLAAGGSTNAHEGLNIGYAMARRVFHRDAVNRVILCSDGVANTGTTHPDAILADVARSAGDDIYLTAIGVGMGNYNDVLLEQLADRGNGHYGYLDDDAEAERFIREHLGAGMEVIAQDVKIQVEFDPAVVAQYRLLGFENRAVADADFTNDAVDAGEIGAGHQVTALYEIEWVAGAEGPAGTVRVRALPPGGGEAMQIEGAIALDGARADFHAASADFKLAAIAAEYAEIMRNSYWARGSKLSDVAARFDAEFPGNPPSPQAAELRMLIERAATVPDARPAAVAPWGTRPPADTDDNPPPGAGGRIDMRTPPPPIDR